MSRSPSRRGPSLPAGPAVAACLLLAATAGLAAPALASPAPVSACPPCADGFVRAAESHGLETDVATSEAVVRAHENGSATWTVRVVPTEERVLNRLAENESLARAVARDSFGVRYGGGIDHELLAVDVREGAFIVRYRTPDVVRPGPLGTHVLTYFREEPGAYVYTDLGADELTVVAPEGTVLARGFGDVDERRMTASALPGVRDGPFVVFAPAGAPFPGVRGALAIAAALAGVLARNVALFVLLPAGVFGLGLAAVRRVVDPTAARDPRRLGAVVAAAGGVALALALLSGVGVVLGRSEPLLVAGSVGGLVGALGLAVALPGMRRRLTVGRLLAVGAAVTLAVTLLEAGGFGAGGLHAALAFGAGLLPATAALGRLDVTDVDRGRLLAAGLVAVLAVGLAAVAPLAALGGSLFLLVPVLLTVAAVVGAAVAAPLYLLGVASAAPVGREAAGETDASGGPDAP